MLLAVAILPFLGLGGAQLYKAEMPGPMKEQRLTPRLAETARGLWGVYFVLSLGCLLAYRWGGMSWSDAFMHIMPTVGLGGCRRTTPSFGYWNSPQLEWTAVLFMSLAGISFARYFMLWRQRSFSPWCCDTEVRAYLGVLGYGHAAGDVDAAGGAGGGRLPQRHPAGGVPGRVGGHHHRLHHHRLPAVAELRAGAAAVPGAASCRARAPPAAASRWCACWCW